MTLQFELRDYQTQGVDALRAEYRSGRRAPLYQLPTGGGKTMVFAYITHSAVARGKRVWILVHRQELLAQASETLTRWGVPHGCISPHYPTTDYTVQIASVQTLVRRMHRYPAPDLIVVDEAHHAVAGTWRRILNTYPQAVTLGVTATAGRLDGRGLGISSGGIFDALVQGPSINELIERGFLARPRVFASRLSLAEDLRALRTRAGDWEQEGLERTMSRNEIIGDAVEHYARLCPGTPAIAFCVSIAHAQAVQQQFSAAGWRARRIDGGMGQEERRGIVGALSDGDLDVMVSVDLVSEGFDVPVCGAAILMRPTQSETLFLQQIGRALRQHPGKECAYILDHAENIKRHGLPQEAREWTLEGRTPRAAAPAVKQCPGCYAMLPASVMTCPECEHCFDVPAAQRGEATGRGGREVVENHDEQLIEVTPEMVRAAAERRRHEVRNATTREDLETIARARGYNLRWVDHVMSARRGRNGARA
jgi:DNA repair protein RadD